MDSMLAMVLDRPDQFQITNVPVPVPGSGEALVRVKSAGICASDLATLHGNSPIASYPLIPGHECVAEVVSAPPGSEFGEGDKVTVFPSVACGACTACGEGRTNHCPTFKVLGIGLPGGCFAEYMVVGVDQLIPVPDMVFDRFGALIEPLAVGVHNNRRADTKPGETVLVMGSGVIGLLAAQVARAKGVARVVLVDRFESRRQMAGKLGFNDFSTARGEKLSAWIAQHVGAVDLVLDTVCTGEMLIVTAQVLRPGGRSVLIGMPHGDAELAVPHPEFYRKELSLIISRNYIRQDFMDAIQLLENGAVEPSAMVTGVFPLKSMSAALAALEGSPEDHLKIMVQP